MRLINKVALVTGGSLGIGRAIAAKFATEGARVAITGRTEQDLHDAGSFIRSQGGVVMELVSDVRFKDQVEQMIDRVLQEWGALDIVVNNAGICELNRFLDIDEAEWDRHIDINLKGAFLVGQRAAQVMADRGAGGSIIHVSSVNGLAAEAMQAHYNASKGGMNLLSMSMAVELAPYGIRVNALCPGFIETRLTQAAIDTPDEITPYLKSIPIGRVGQPEEVADAALFLASDESRYVTGHNLVVDGGQFIKLA